MKVWLVNIDHRHGSTRWIAESEKLAYEVVARYCRYWWGDQHGEWDDAPREIPENEDELIGAYFNAMQDSEWFTIQDYEVVQQEGQG